MTDTIKITMSERRPITIVKADWPIVARASWQSGVVERQANYVAWIWVRGHKDGRAIVYGAAEAGPGGAPIGYRARRAGYMISGSSEIVRAIRRVGGVIEHNELADECIGDLPEEIL